MLAFAAVNRFWLTPRLVAVRRKRRKIALRALTRNSIDRDRSGLSIFAIVGLLGTLHPAIHLL